MFIDYTDDYCPVCWIENDEAILLDIPSPGRYTCRKFPKHYDAGNPIETYKFLLTRKVNEKTQAK